MASMPATDTNSNTCDCSSGPLRKRPRVTTTVGAAVPAVNQNGGSAGARLLEDLLMFGAVDTGLSSGASSCSPAPTGFTLRLEHRMGGSSASAPQHNGGGGEERLLIFRSDRAGAIAKIIYSSSPTAAAGKNCCSSKEKDDADGLVVTVQAKIHVLECKEAYRGLDLGGLLFCEALASLRRTYYNNDCNNTTTTRTIIHCQLDAEEDERRHTRLVRFYEELGCRVRTEQQGTKHNIQYLNNNDGETYRKVPMSIDLLLLAGGTANNNNNNNNCSLSNSSSNRSCFLPVNLLLDNGRRVRASPSRRRDHWLLQMSDDAQTDTTTNHHPVLQIRTTSGMCLAVEDGVTGTCSLVVVSSYSTQHNHCHHFQLRRVADDDDDVSTSCNESPQGSAGGGLWLIQSIEYGTFLSLQRQQKDGDDPDHTENGYIFQCQTLPSYWKVVSSSSSWNCSGWSVESNNTSKNLMWTTDNPSLRRHYRALWKTQCLGYVRRMKTKYLLLQENEEECCQNNSNSHPRMSLRTALLDHAQSIPADPFEPTNRTKNRDCENHGMSISLCTLAFQCAECVRAQGHPDWVQLVALLYHLGRVRPLLGEENRTKQQDEYYHYDWSIASRSRVLGCPVPEQASFGEFRSLRPTEDAKFESPSSGSHNTGMYELHCGLANVELTWTGPEYMYYMLQLNESAIPDEGLAMLRLASLSDWHTRNAYSDLESAEDVQVKPLVADLDRMLTTTARQRQARRLGEHELSAEACHWLWTSHYADIAAKYNVDGALQW